ncbi:hypothetical protein LIER_41416 [Lithospermum erythrorhizon]|uniref:Reverse transcriptase zinc-binding domain-containing protein n=1 Tax=Lithospermum erythrorhizon TaxID=34254 RepID=A0AAV3R8X5_LITER
METLDHVKKWKDEESQEHLFFKCDFAAYVWPRLLGMREKYRPTRGITWEMKWMEKFRASTKMENDMMKLVFGAAIYVI